MDAPAAANSAPAVRPGIAERLWQASRVEFSQRGYHGARVQGIARGASCNVALMYRHWTSKRALYQDVLRSVWLSAAAEMARLLEARPPEPGGVVVACLDAMMRDPMGAQILVREYLDGAPFLSQLAEAEPALLEPVRRAASTLSPASGDGLDPVLAVLTVGGLAALVASAGEADRPFGGVRIAPEAWRRQVHDLLVNGLGAGRRDEAGGGAVRRDEAGDGAGGAALR
jgi:TetR/AcrR family transcriptional regulator